MNTFLRFLVFSFSYFRKYWWRFTIGVALGFFYGMSNTLTVGSVTILLGRLTTPEHIQSIINAGNAATKAQTDPKTAVTPTWKTLNTRLEQELYVAIDPWLPLRGRELDWKQCLGLFMLFPMLAFLREFLATAVHTCWLGWGNG